MPLRHDANPLAPVIDLAQRFNSRSWRLAYLSLREQLVDLVFPPRCVNCKRVGSCLCAECLSQSARVLPPLCEHCGRAIATLETKCSACARQPLRVDAVRAVGYHDGALREAIHALKYNRVVSLARPLGGLLSQWLRENQWNADFIVPVPLHPERERERGYNQAELIARVVSAQSHIPLLDRALVRVRPTQDQIGLERAARQKNVRDAFRAIDSRVQDKTTLVIDDVTTTGATLEACASALYNCNARRVFGLTVTRPR